MRCGTVDALDYNQQLGTAEQGGGEAVVIFLGAHEGEHGNSRRQWSIALELVALLIISMSHVSRLDDQPKGKPAEAEVR